ncbi:MAG: hypothetical protein JWR24_2780 [Actinoallomurus sp.]|nr:hypothetical protein [Actinoallomurus sp.]
MRGTRLLVLLALGTCLVATPPAYGSPMMTVTGDKNHIGNGCCNRNAVSIRSPTTNKGPQAISNTNAGGVTSSRNAICKKTRYCHIRQTNFWEP